MKDKKTIIIAIVVLLLAIVATVGASYAYFATATKTTGNENERRFRDWNIGAKGYGITAGRSIMNLSMIPYNWTDTWMQSIAFMASARHTELLNKATGKTSTLWDAYTVKDNKLVLKGNPSDWYIKDKNLEAI